LPTSSLTSFTTRRSAQKTSNRPGTVPSTSKFRFVDGPSRTWSSSAQSHYERSDHHPTGLVKQAYSAWVLDSVHDKPRKWHLTAYFTYSDLPSIPTVDQDPVLRKITVPSGIYKSGKARSRASDAIHPAMLQQQMSPSRPNSPVIARTSSPSPRNRRDSVVLPSLQSTISDAHLNMHSVHHRPHGARLAEDQRMIQMLNSRPIL